MIENSRILPKIPFEGLNLISHLIYHDGPYLSHFEDRHGRNILFHWCNVTETHNQWVVFSVTSRQMSSFLQKELSQRELILHPEGNISYLVDINNEGEHDKVMSLSPNAIPEDYLSSPDSYFDESLSPYIGDGYAYLLGRTQELRREIETKSLITRFPEQWHPEMTTVFDGKALPIPC